MADAKRTLRECLDERLKEGRARGLERRPPLLDMAGEGPVVHMGGRAFLNFTLNDGLGLASCWTARLCGSPGTCQHRPRARIGESRCADICPCGLWAFGTAARFRPSRHGTAAGDDGVLVQYGRYGTRCVPYG